MTTNDIFQEYLNDLQSVHSNIIQMNELELLLPVFLELKSLIEKSNNTLVFFENIKNQITQNIAANSKSISKLQDLIIHINTSFQNLDNLKQVLEKLSQKKCKFAEKKINDFIVYCKQILDFDIKNIDKQLQYAEKLLKEIDMQNEVYTELESLYFIHQEQIEYFTAVNNQFKRWLNAETFNENAAEKLIKLVSDQTLHNLSEIKFLVNQYEITENPSNTDKELQKYIRYIREEMNLLEAATAKKHLEKLFEKLHQQQTTTNKQNTVEIPVEELKNITPKKTNENNAVYNKLTALYETNENLLIKFAKINKVFNETIKAEQFNTEKAEMLINDFNQHRRRLSSILQRIEEVKNTDVSHDFSHSELSMFHDIVTADLYNGLKNISENLYLEEFNLRDAENNLIRTIEKSNKKLFTYKDLFWLYQNNQNAINRFEKIKNTITELLYPDKFNTELATQLIADFNNSNTTFYRLVQLIDEAYKREFYEPYYHHKPDLVIHSKCISDELRNNLNDILLNTKLETDSFHNSELRLRTSLEKLQSDFNSFKGLLQLIDKNYDVLSFFTQIWKKIKNKFAELMLANKWQEINTYIISFDYEYLTLTKTTLLAGITNFNPLPTSPEPHKKIVYRVIIFYKELLGLDIVEDEIKKDLNYKNVWRFFLYQNGSLISGYQERIYFIDNIIEMVLSQQIIDINQKQLLALN